MLSFHLGKKPFMYREQCNSCIILKYNSKILHNTLKEYLFWEGKKTYSIRLRTIDHPIAFLQGFVRGFLDGDGYTSKNGRKVSLFSTSEEMMKQIFTMIESFHFNPKRYVY